MGKTKFPPPTLQAASPATPDAPADSVASDLPAPDVSGAASGGDNDDVDTANNSGPAATTAPADPVRGNEEGAQLGDGKASNPGQEGRGREGNIAIDDKSEAPKPEGVVSGADTRKEEGAADQGGGSGGDTSDSCGDIAGEAEGMAVVEEGLPTATAPLTDTTATSGQTEVEKTQESERELCAKLVQIRAEKLQQIKGGWERVRAFYKYE